MELKIVLKCEDCDNVLTAGVSGNVVHVWRCSCVDGAIDKAYKQGELKGRNQLLAEQNAFIDKATATPNDGPILFLCEKAESCHDGSCRHRFSHACSEPNGVAPCSRFPGESVLCSPFTKRPGGGRIEG